MKQVNIEGLKELLAKAPGLPWAYRPWKHDDWGYVRAEEGGIICQARDPDIHEEEDLSAHRRAKTDPWEVPARLIVEGVNALPALLSRIERLEEALRRAALDLHTAAGRFSSISKLDPKGCAELTREAARRAESALTPQTEKPGEGK